MSATVISEALNVMSGGGGTGAPTAEITSTKIDVDVVKCDCCGLMEECTMAYIERIRERYQGKWICGLCAEAVKDEIVRCERMMISTEEAMNRHFNFCKKFKTQQQPIPDPTVHLITAMRQILRRSLDSAASPKALRSMPCSPTKKTRLGGDGKHAVLTRSESCIPSLSLVDSAGGFGDCGLEG